MNVPNTRRCRCRSRRLRRCPPCNFAHNIHIYKAASRTHTRNSNTFDHRHRRSDTRANYNACPVFAAATAAVDVRRLPAIISRWTLARGQGHCGGIVRQKFAYVSFANFEIKFYYIYIHDERIAKSQPLCWCCCCSTAAYKDMD